MIFPLPQGPPLILTPTSSTLNWNNPTPAKATTFHQTKTPGFQISITTKGTTVQHHSPVERAMAIAYLSRLSGNTKKLPTGTVVFQPKTAWRGVHLFVGPDALAIHKRLWTRVLLPLGFNKVVLQCQQTEWETLPNLKGGISMKRGDLAKLCDWYRSVGVEPIPLVQSFGHSTWISRGNKNLDLFVNPKIPFTLDPRKPRVAKLMNKLWDEVIAVTKARTIHFGLDEIAFRGMPNDPATVTKLWKLQVPMLAKIAARHKVQSTAWGDQILAGEESAPPTGSPTATEAKIRRSVLPKGMAICDWHYQNNSDPTLYIKSIRTLQKEGFKVIGSAWHRPKNIEGMNLAAIATGAGSLQTTWAGHELNQKVIDKEIRQFSAFVLAAYFQWGGTHPTLDANAVFRRLYSP